jgi:hypothetical protein
MKRILLGGLGAGLGLVALLGLTQFGYINGVINPEEISPSTTGSAAPNQSQKPEPKATQERKPSAKYAAAIARHRDRLREIALFYESYGRVMKKMRLTNFICAFQPISLVTGITLRENFVQFSSSRDSATHGKKLYFLFAKPNLIDLSILGNDPPFTPHPVGQIVVKEAWVPEEVDKATPQKPLFRKIKTQGNEFALTGAEKLEWVPYVRHKGRLYHAARKAGLFIMFKMDPKTPDTDNGWVYGTISPDGKQITSAGRVKSCMTCHQRAPHDRIFGPSEN